MKVSRYDPAEKATWDEFVGRSKNGTFLFLRDYMDYHRDRFHDHSLMVHDAKGNLLALLPAHEEGRTLCSHHGLTYGGFVTGDSMKVLKMAAVFLAVLRYCRTQGIETITYRCVPHIYHRSPAEEDLYALLLCKAELESRVVMSVIAGEGRPPFQKTRRYGSRMAKKNGVEIREGADFEAFWRILEMVLWETYGAKPVHTVDEIRLLHDGFPERIKLRGAFKGGEMVAGTVIYDSDRVARAQYIAASPAGKAISAVDLLFDELLHGEFSDKPFFEFGTSQMPEGDNLNRGLIRHKEGFGARTIMLDYYRIDLTRWTPDALQSALNA